MARQCECTSIPCQTVCEVTCQSELQDALDCLGNPSTNTCTHIVIPAGCTVDIESPIVIDYEHSGTPEAPNRLSIQGTVQWVGDDDGSQKIFYIWPANFIIDGGGTITSIYNPANSQYHCDFPCGIVKAILVDGAVNLTIRDLTATNVGSFIEIIATGPTNENIDLINLHSTNVSHAGFFGSDRVDTHFNKCTSTKTYWEHGFRFYATDLRVENCSSYGASDTGLWAVEGDDVHIVRFASDRWIRIGPNPAIASTSLLTNVVAEDLECTGTTPYSWVEMGTYGACIVNFCTPGMNVGRVPSQVNHSLDLDYVNWANVTGPVDIASNPEIGTHVGPIQYSYCSADIDRSGEVDVVDLLELIANWGPCPTPPTGYSSPNPPCPGDIHPAGVCGGNDTVNVNDLLLVISSWGGCPATQACGDIPAKAAGEPKEPPQSLEDCYDRCSQQYPEGGDRWADCYDDCVRALEELGLLE